MNRPMTGSLRLVGLTVLVAAATLFAAGRQGVVRTVDGDTFEGEISDEPTQIVIRRSGVDTVVDKAKIASIEYSTYEQRFDRALAALLSDDAAGRVELARDAYARRAYDLALRALDAAMEIDPLNRDAAQLQTVITNQLQLEAQQRRDGDRTARPAPGPAAQPTTRKPRGLDELQINRVRQWELRRDDTHVRIGFRNNVRKRFVDALPGMDYRAFISRSDLDQAMMILEKGDRAMADDVAIVTEPNAIQVFNRRIQTAVVQGCATSRCHGGDNAGDFRLMTGPSDPASSMTNFYLLNAYARALEPGPGDGLFAQSSASMILRGDGKNSLLYQYALPRQLARLKHPPVKNWDGLVRHEGDRLAREIVRWMDVDLIRLVPDYGFTFRLPTQKAAATEPASEPLAEPTTEPSDEADPSPVSPSADPEPVRP